MPTGCKAPRFRIRTQKTPLFLGDFALIKRNVDLEFALIGFVEPVLELARVQQKVSPPKATAGQILVAAHKAAPCSCRQRLRIASVVLRLASGCAKTAVM